MVTRERPISLTSVPDRPVRRVALCGLQGPVHDLFDDLGGNGLRGLSGSGHLGQPLPLIRIYPRALAEANILKGYAPLHGPRAVTWFQECTAFFGRVQPGGYRLRATDGVHAIRAPAHRVGSLGRTAGCFPSVAAVLRSATHTGRAV